MLSVDKFSSSMRNLERGVHIFAKAVKARLRGYVGAVLSTIRNPSRLKARIKLLPLQMALGLKRSLPSTIKLDYPAREIFLFVESEMDIFRSNACSKEPGTVRWIEENVKPGDVLYDIGANVGAYSLVAAKHTDGKAMVYAFEPSFSTYYHLRLNVMLNSCQKSITPQMIPLSRKSGVSDFNYVSLEPGSSNHTFGNTINYKGDNFEPIHQEKVIGFSIDDLVSEYGFPIPNHIKLDVDGIELDILMGAEQTLNQSHVKSILVEVYEGLNDHHIMEFLASKGFSKIVRFNRKGSRISNYIFRREVSPTN